MYFSFLRTIVKIDLCIFLKLASVNVNLVKLNALQRFHVARDGYLCFSLFVDNDTMLDHCILSRHSL